MNAPPLLPRPLRKVGVPPLKCQGIKTRLVPFIFRNIRWTGRGRWIEPFLGSGVVLFNLLPERAIVCDTNRHIIQLYRDIQTGYIDEGAVGSYLEEAGKQLSRQGERFYYEMRERFNRCGGSLEFLFLNRSCFNGMMRFNGRGEMNVPFCRKPERFRKAYTTKIRNQVRWVSEILQRTSWEFRTCDWQETVLDAGPDDFIYADPPYIGRHTGYYNTWTERDAVKLAHSLLSSSSGFAMSMWKGNKYRSNPYIDRYWKGCEHRTCGHFYHIGPTESFRNSMEEVLIVKPGFASAAG
ncbi:MAG: Dam family site-specific DNA-(adenine-N6)-methyltransferase [Syntrophobacteraceae bacterium]|nr:Dam family site-specific DNA-(adenine-N6)-methyltransferase [Desulfobacteraceae bacterium]